MDLSLERMGSITEEGMRKLKVTYSYVFLGLIMAVVGASIGVYSHDVIRGWVFLGLVIAEFAVLFWFMFSKSIPSYVTFTLLTGLTMAPVLNKLIGMGQSYVILQAFLGTAIVVGGLTLYTLTTKHNFMKYSTILFWVLIALVVVTFINIFVGSSLLSLIMSYITVVLFSFYIIMDTQEVLYTNIHPLDAAMSIYLDILNIFMALLNIFSDRD